MRPGWRSGRVGAGFSLVAFGINLEDVGAAEVELKDVAEVKLEDVGTLAK